MGFTPSWGADMSPHQLAVSLLLHRLELAQHARTSPIKADSLFVTDLAAAGMPPKRAKFQLIAGNGQGVAINFAILHLKVNRTHIRHLCVPNLLDV